MRLLATDRSRAALEVARRNVERLGQGDRIQLLEGSLFEPLGDDRFDLVVSNPPYLAESEQADLPPELRHEPREALFAGADGTAVLRPLIEAAAGHLLPGGVLALELAPDQAEPALGWLATAGFVGSRVHRDLAERPRVVTGTRPTEDGRP